MLTLKMFKVLDMVVSSGQMMKLNMLMACAKSLIYIIIKRGPSATGHCFNCLSLPSTQVLQLTKSSSSGFYYRQFITITSYCFYYYYINSNLLLLPGYLLLSRYYYR